MKRFICTTLICLTLMIYPSFAAKLGDLKEVSKPYRLKPNKNRLYVIDEMVKIHIYSLKPFKFIKSILNKGEGPGEFKYSPQCIFYPDFIYLYTYFKGMYLNNDSTYKGEFRTKYQFNGFFPVGRNFVGKRVGINNRNQKPYSEISIYQDNKTFKTSKMIYYLESPPSKPGKGGKEDYCLFNNNVSDFTVYDNKIFIWETTSGGCCVFIFDSNGNELNRIKLNLENQKISQAFKDKYIEYWKTFSKAWEYLNARCNVFFPEYFPYFQKIEVNKGKIYIYTYNFKGNEREVIITDLKGKVLKKIFVPLMYFINGIDYTIDDDNFYYVIENEESEEWELHMVNLK